MLRWALTAAVLALLQACAAPRAEADRGLGGVEADANYATVNVFYATDRQPTGSTAPSKMFGGERGDVQYGTAKVSIPRNHKMGELEAPSVWKLEFRADPEKHVVLLDVAALDAAAFFAGVSQRVQKSAKKSALVFVHGYNVSFEDAARRTAQMAYDLGFDGAPAFYSWPSQADVAKYTIDENNVAWSTPNLERFLADFAERSDAERVFLVGHSMGTRALTQAYAALLEAKPQLKRKFVEVILAAPDIDAAIFKRDIAPALLAGQAPVTLYASSEDVPLRASKAVHGAPRAGDAGPDMVIVPGIECIDATGMGTDFLNHSYFAQNRSILSDIFYIVHNGLRAPMRAGLEPVTAPPALTFWKFRN
jgi:esterase/lipase superfamily enzyme